jgi:hypothetical protein
MDKGGSGYLKCGRCQASGDCFEVQGPSLALLRPTNAYQVGHVAAGAQKALHEALVAYYAVNKPVEAPEQAPGDSLTPNGGKKTKKAAGASTTGDKASEASEAAKKADLARVVREKAEAVRGALGNK